MKIKITAPGIYNAKGEEIAVGTELTVKSEPTGWAGRYTVLSAGGEEKVAITNPSAEIVAPAGPFTVVERSPGWFGIDDGEGNPVGKNLRKNDLEGFDDLSDEDKLAFAAEHAKAAA